ncbi:MAG: alpha/beta hydrolase, partial [Leptospiraceae bacterium]|nr:alpha/beta hydrolase [Leptospiraceae bacterium]
RLETEYNIIFVHGSPGGWSAFQKFLGNVELGRQARLISVDRPGYGGTLPGRAVPSLADQSRIISAVLHQSNGTVNRRRNILVGHSLGGPIVIRMAMQYPDLVDAVVVVAGSVDPQAEEIRWYNSLAHTMVMRRLLPRDWIVSNDELLPLKSELMRMEPMWNDLRIPLIVLHGTEDDLVPVANAEYIRTHVPPELPVSIRIIDGADHFILWEQPELVIDCIEEALQVSVTATR